MNDLTLIPTPELLQMYANADVTCGCGGHHKGNMNESYRLAYSNELRSRGIIVPASILEKVDKTFESNIEIPAGIFNGVGSY